jgi:putative SOS response-associated peptidase YedK
MCGRYTLRTPLNVLAEQFLFELGDVQAVPRYNIPPTTNVLQCATRGNWCNSAGA